MRSPLQVETALQNDIVRRDVCIDKPSWRGESGSALRFRSRPSDDAPPDTALSPV